MESITYAEVYEWDNLWRAWRKAAFDTIPEPQ